MEDRQIEFDPLNVNLYIHLIRTQQVDRTLSVSNIKEVAPFTVSVGSNALQVSS